MSEAPAALLLAAGSGSRMGGAKALRRLAGETLVARAARTALASRCASLTVVTGATHEGVAEALAAVPCRLVRNPAPERGQGHSIALGVRSLDALGADSMVMLLVDQPFVTAEHIDALLDALDEGHPCAASAYAGVLGAPAAFSRARFAALAALEGDRGARALLRDAGGEVAAVSFEDAAFDLDTEDDLARAEARAAGEPR